MHVLKGDAHGGGAPASEPADSSEEDDPHTFCAEDEDDSQDELLQVADTSDDDSADELDESCPWPEAVRVAQLDKLPEYKRLKDLGLHVRPAGCALAVNPTKKVWRGHGGESVHYSRAWDGTKKRTCWQALLIIMKLLLEAHLELSPRDKLAKKQLSAISNLRAKEPPHDD